MKYYRYALALLLGSTIPGWADDPPPKAAKAEFDSVCLICRTMTQHIMVRAKINGKGPFNFIIDSGAPLVFVNTAVGKKLGLEVDPDTNAATLDRLEIEGGVVLKKLKVRVETPFQLEGMNGMGLAGAELQAACRRLRRWPSSRSRWTSPRIRWAGPPRLQAPLPAGKSAPRASSVRGGLEAEAPSDEVHGLSSYGTQDHAGHGPPTRVHRHRELPKRAMTSRRSRSRPYSPRVPRIEAGLKAGDQIVEINGVKVVQSLADVLRITAESNLAGQSLQNTDLTR